MTEKRLSLGINVSILLILTIFGILLSLPLKLLLNTNYDAQNHQNESENDTGILSAEAKNKEILESLIDYRKLKRCRRHRYENQIRSIFYSDYDQNCTYVKVLTKEEEETTNDSFEPINEVLLKVNKKVEEKEKEDKIVEKEQVENSEEEELQESKEIVVAGHILVTMLLVSAIAALVEVLRIRFSKDKSKRLKGRISLTKE